MPPDAGSPVQVLLRGVLGGRKGGRKQKTRPHGAEESVRAGPLSIPKSSAYSRYAYRHEAEQPPPAAGHREQTIIRSTRSR